MHRWYFHMVLRIFEFHYYRIDSHRKRRIFLICYTYGFALMCNAVSKLFVCGFPWCHGCSTLEPCTHCELKSERMPYTVRMNNKIKEHGSPDLNSETVLGKQYGYSCIFVTDFFVFRAVIFLSSLTFDGFLCSVPTSVYCLEKKCVFREICCYLFAIGLHMC